MKHYTYTKQLAEAGYETKAYGVIIHAHGGNAVCWWRVPEKYVNMVRISSSYDFCDFLAETGVAVDEDIIIVADSIRMIVFRCEANFTDVEIALVHGSPVGGLNVKDRYNWLTTLRNDALNEAANKAVHTKNRFCDFIRAHYYKERMKNG